jgi:hypothetical protein
MRVKQKAAVKGRTATQARRAKPKTLDTCLAAISDDKRAALEKLTKIGG